MGKKKGAKRSGKQSASSTPVTISNKRAPLRKQASAFHEELNAEIDSVGLRLIGNLATNEYKEENDEIEIDPATGGRLPMPTALNMDYDEFDAAVEIPLNHPKSSNPPKHAYKTCFLSHDDVTTPDPTARNRTESLKSQCSRQSLATARSLSRSRELADGGAYEVFHSNRNSDHSFLDNAAEERSLAGFPRAAFGSSRSSIRSTYQDGDENVLIRRESQPGDLERLNFSTRSRSNSGLSGGFGDQVKLDEADNTNHESFPRIQRSRTVSETSRKSATFGTDNSHNVRAYHADSGYLQNRLSRLSIHTNNDEFVLIGGRPPSVSTSRDELGGRSNIPAIRINDVSIASDVSERKFSHASSDFQRNSRYDGTESDDIGRSISQYSIDRNRETLPLSRTSSKHTVGTTSNTDDRLLLAEKHSQRPEAEGLVPIPAVRSRSVSRIDSTSNIDTLIASHRNSICSTTSDRVNFAEIPVLYSHPDDNFGGDDDPNSVPFRPTSEHKKTPTREVSRTELRQEKKSEDGEPPKPLIVTSALTPVTKRIATSSVFADIDEPKTPQTVQRVSESRSIRQNMQQVTQKTTHEIAIQTGETIRLRQTKRNADVLSELANIGDDNSQQFDISPAKTISFVPRTKPKMNNSFEKNGHPAVSVLSTMLANRVEGAKPSKSDSDMSGPPSSRSNSSHQVTMVPNGSRSSQMNLFQERMNKLSEHYRDGSNGIDLNGNVQDPQFAPLSTSTPAKPQKLGASAVTRAESVENEAFQKTGSEKSINSMGQTVVDAKWVEGKRTNGDTIRKHVPRGRIRDLASAFENNQVIRKVSPTRKVEENRSERDSRVLSNSDIRSRTSSNRLDGSSMSSNAFIHSTHTISAKDDSRRRSTSSSLNHPNVFTRNTFVRNSKSVAPQITENAPNSGSITINSHSDKDQNMQGDDGFVSMFERIPSFHKLPDSRPKPTDVKTSGGVSSLRQRNENPAAGDYQRRSQSVATPPPSRTDMYRRTMPVGKSGNTPILRRQTTTIETRPDSNPPMQSAKEFQLGSAVEIPIQRVEVPVKKKSPYRMERAKTQEVPETLSPPRYQRTVSGGIGDDQDKFEAEKSFFTHSRDVFGMNTAEDLTSLEREQPWSPQKTDWKTTTTTTLTTYSTQKFGNRNLFEERVKKREEEERREREELEKEKASGYYRNGGRPLEVSPKMARESNDLFEKHPSKFDLPKNMSIPPYSPPATEDAGSRITHHTLTTFQDDAGSTDNRMTTEDSSIRGKIDRMFDFVENDDSSTRKNLLPSSTIGSADTTIGRRFEKKEAASPTKKYANYTPINILRQNQQHGEWERSLESGQVSSPLRRRVINSPERRNTVVGNESHDQTDFEYSLSQYREMQRQQLRRRVSSSEEPQFFRSPSLNAPHAGQSMQAYRTRDVLGTPVSVDKVRLNSLSSGMRIPPAALATSTPIDSPQSLNSFSMRNGSSRIEINNNNFLHNAHLHMPNDTFVSSISGVSAVDKHTEFRRKIDRMSYIIENTQKQMTMNEAALADAIKKGRKTQEIAAHRSILISRETLRLQRAELRRLHAFSAVRRPPPPIARQLRGNAVFNGVSIVLNKNFVSRLTPNDDNSFAFVALFKCGHQVEATEYVPLRVQSSDPSDEIHFEKQIQFSDVPVDFAVTVEFYAMRVTPNVKPVEQSFAAKCKNLMGPPHKKSPPPSLETAFKCRGRITLDRDAAGERSFYVDDVTYPLEGTVIITTQCSRLPDAFEADFRGFLTMFLTISEMASWERYWAVLRRGIILFWKYPDDEQTGKEPRMQIDLTKCTNNSIEKCPFDVCPRPDSFSIDILVETDEAKIGSVVEKKRVLLSADSTDMLNQWLFAVNQTLDVIRGPI